MEPLSLSEKLHSTRNRLFWSLRSAIRFQRTGYTETCDPKDRDINVLTLSKAASNAYLDIEARYNTKPFLNKISYPNYEKNLFTLWSLEQMLPKGWHPSEILEVGSQDFSRTPAYANFFPATKITGIEIDPFPVLRELHSRMDKAKYYISHFAPKSTYEEGDFFKWNKRYELIICFYPFVSTNPALAWGLPANLGNPLLWIHALEKNLTPGALALLVHQGDWEEETFDEVRKKIPNQLELVERKILNCPFYQNKYPAHASLYQRK